MISTLYNMLGWIFIVLAHWKKHCTGRLVVAVRHIFLISKPSSLCSNSLMLCVLWSSNRFQLYSLCLGLTWLVLKPKMYHTQGEHAIHYTTGGCIWNEHHTQGEHAIHYTTEVVVFEMNTTLKVSMISITPQVVVFEMNILMKCRFSPVQMKT